MEVLEDRRQQILSAAINRFAHFGVGKTSMTEIAKDVNLSKTNLYYYFHDKMEIMAAIIRLLIDESEEALSKEELSHLPTELILEKLLEFKIQYFEKYRLLFQELSLFTGNDPRFEKMASEMMEREIERIAGYLKSGILRGELVTMDVQETSKLYVSIMRGLTTCSLKLWQNPVLDGRLLHDVLEEQKQVNRLFFNGIKKNSSNK
jgi:TetR/AcrR family transcriptional regulator